MPGDEDRAIRIGAILDAVTVLGGVIRAEQKRPFAGVSLTASQVRALYLLAHAREPVTPARLAEALGVTAGAVTQLVDGLRGEGLVETAPHPSDGRSRVLALTPDAAAEVDTFEAAVVRRMAPLFEVLDDDALTHVAEGLGAVARGA